MRFASRSTEPVGMTKDASSCGQIANSNRRRVRKRKNATKEKNSNHYFTVRLGADARWDDLPNRKFASDRCVLIFLDKRHRVDNASIRDICR